MTAPTDGDDVPSVKSSPTEEVATATDPNQASGDSEDAQASEDVAGSDPGQQSAPQHRTAGAINLELPKPPTPLEIARTRRRPARVKGDRSLRARVDALASRVEDRAAVAERRRDLVPVYVFRVALQVLRQWARDRCPQQAASLAFQTVLSIVPLVAVLLSVLRATGNTDAHSTFVAFIAREMIPVAPETISATLVQWSQNVTFQTVGVIGLVTTVLLAFVMINSLERVMNSVWRAEHKRSTAQKFVVFYATATIGPALLGVSLVQAAKFGLTSGPAAFFLSFGLTFGSLYLANYFLPALHVRWHAAFVGALVTAVLFELAKWAFTVYVTEVAFAKFSGIYGAVALAPIVLVWIYYAWLVFLLGVEVSHAVQNVHIIARADRRRPISLENEILSRVNGATAARIMTAVTAGYLRGDKVVSRRHLEDKLDLSDEVLERLIDRLKTRDLLIEVTGSLNGLMPARPPSEITLAEVLRAFRGSDPEETSGAVAPIDRVLAELATEENDRAAKLVLTDLV